MAQKSGKTLEEMLDIFKDYDSIQNKYANFNKGQLERQAEGG